MTRLGTARRLFAVLAFSAAGAALALAGGGCGGRGTELPIVDPPTILAPQPGDKVGKTFSVQGTYGNPGVVVTVKTEGAHNDPTGKTATTDPSWSVGFGPASSIGLCTAKASVPNSSVMTVAFEIVEDTDVEVEDLETRPDPSPVTNRTHTGTAKVKYKKNLGDVRKIYVTLFIGQGPGNVKYGPTEAIQQGEGNMWHAPFPGVDEAYYGVQAKVEKTDGTIVTITKLARVPK